MCVLKNKLSMIPRIRRNRDKDFPECKWEVKGKGFTNLCGNLWQAFHNWLWCCGVKPSIAFWWVRFKKNE